MSKQLTAPQRRAVWAVAIVLPIMAVGFFYLGRDKAVSAEKPADIVPAEPSQPVSLASAPSNPPTAVAPKPKKHIEGQPAPESDSDEGVESGEDAELVAPRENPVPATPTVEVTFAPRVPITSEPLVPPVIELKAEFTPRIPMTNAPLVPPVVEIRTEAKPRQ